MARWLGSYEERSLEIEYCAGIRKKPGYILNLKLVILILTKNGLLNTSLHSRDCTCFAGFFLWFCQKTRAGENLRVLLVLWSSEFGKAKSATLQSKVFFFRSASMEIKLLSALELLSKRGSVAEQFAFIYFTFRTVACQRTCAHSFFHFAMAHPVKTPPQYKM